MIHGLTVALGVIIIVVGAFIALVSLGGVPLIRRSTDWERRKAIAQVAVVALVGLALIVGGSILIGAA